MQFEIVLKTDDPKEVSNILRAIITSYKKDDTPLETISKAVRMLRDPDTGEHHTLGEKPSAEPETKQLKCADPKCGKLFTPVTKKSLYCSNKCYQRSYWHLHSKLKHRDQFTLPEKPANTPAKDEAFHKKLKDFSRGAITPVSSPNIIRNL